MRRRTLTHAAWSMPVLIVGALAPMASASIAPAVTVATGCKLPGQSTSLHWSYRVELTVTSPTRAALSVASITPDTWTITRPTSAVIVPAGTSTVVAVLSSTNSANAAATITYRLGDALGTVVVTVGAWKPCKDDQCQSVGWVA